MAGFRSLFKVRQPGNGNAVQQKFERATRAKISVETKSSTGKDGGARKAVR